jgi:hypothetical protein
MIRELAAMTGSSTLVIILMFLFIAVFGIAMWRLWRQDPREAEAHGRIPLEDAQVPDPDAGTDREPDADKKADDGEETRTSPE